MKSGCGPNNVVKACAAVCGSSDQEIYVDSVCVKLDERFVDSVLRLKDEQVKTYIKSRVTGHLHLTVVQFVQCVVL